MKKNNAHRLVREYWKMIANEVFDLSMESLWSVFSTKEPSPVEIRNSPLYRSTKKVKEGDLSGYLEAFDRLLDQYVPTTKYRRVFDITATFIDRQVNEILLSTEFGNTDRFILLRRAVVEEIADWMNNPANNSSIKQRHILTSLLTAIFWFLITANSLCAENAFQVKHRYVLDYLERKCKSANAKDETIDRELVAHNILEIRRGNPVLRNVKVTLNDDTFIIPVNGDSTIPKGTAWDLCREYMKIHRKEMESQRKTTYEELTKRNNGLFRNDEIVGVLSTNGYAEYDGQPSAEYSLYRTDYFTHRIVESMLKALDDHINNDDLNLEMNGFRRTSLGVNVIVRIPKENKIILVRRGRNAAYNNAGFLYPSVVETVDLVHRDFSEDHKNPLVAAISRGLEEELGIRDIFSLKETDRNKAIYTQDSIWVRSLFYTQRYRQDNVFATVTLNQDVTISKLDFLCSNVAVDYAFENDGKFICVNDDPTSIRQFVYDHYYEMIEQTHYCLLQYLALWESGAFVVS